MASRVASRPNVVLIISDDQGAWALGAAGNPEIQTPHLDALAASGTRFSNFFCTSPVCSPARATLFTGQPPSKHGVHDWISAHHVGADGIDFLRGQPLVTDVLSDHGYRCGLSGKWHLGANDQPHRGFEHWFAHQLGGGPYYGAPVVRDGELINEPNYLTEAIGDDARTFLESADGHQDPFWLSVNFTAPHAPWKDNHPEEFTKLYQDTEFASCPQEPDHPWTRYSSGGWPLGREQDVRQSLVGYFAAISAMDRQIGRIVDDLRDRGLLESTVIMFLSDNGYSCGQHGVWGKGNGTYPLNMYEEAVKVPAMISMPGTIPAQICDELISGYDLAPTLLELAGLRPDALGDGPGSSFADLITGGDQPRDRVVIFDEYGATRMIRTRQWKYVLRRGDEPDELYDLDADPGERNNLVEDPGRRDRVAGLRAELEDWFGRYADPAFDSSNLEVTGLGQTEVLVQTEVLGRS
ncbi:sulfatase-like hydrolase/transferase [Microlunatus elymi]|uniref:Sulfatase-like hydrolase/transferase n=1 Tax=Microlunatus elymi TaxID=2596828 RepID=A0A516Q3R3_9ACTN|nr:sulfatase-like hydrolase/transferase [Microlunatus elymi]QDP98065.1 sulfatase-like hydrolase/transferase [Microlunatus elymi]